MTNKKKQIIAYLHPFTGEVEFVDRESVRASKYTGTADLALYVHKYLCYDIGGDCNTEILHSRPSESRLVALQELKEEIKSEIWDKTAYFQDKLGLVDFLIAEAEGMRK